METNNADLSKVSVQRLQKGKAASTGLGLLCLWEILHQYNVLV